MCGGGCRCMCELSLQEVWAGACTVCAVTTVTLGWSGALLCSGGVMHGGAKPCGYSLVCGLVRAGVVSWRPSGSRKIGNGASGGRQIYGPAKRVPCRMLFGLNTPGTSAIWC